MSDSPPHGQELSVRLLGEVEVVKNGAAVALPPSKKTRALLAYLTVVRRPQRRERLCSMLWEIPDDPRGALRWSLSKLRGLIDGPGIRVVADRDTIAFDTSGIAVDLFEVRAALADGIDAVATERLAGLAELFRGEFLEGLDLPACHDFQAWCTAEREDARMARVRILDALVGRLADDPERALPYARTLVRIEVAEEAFRARLVALLARCGRREEAERQYEIGRRLLTEMGVPASGALDAARPTASVPTAATRAQSPPGDDGPGPSDTRDGLLPLIGRDAELRHMLDELARTATQRCERVVLLTGEPGVGKTRLLAEFMAEARRSGATVLDGCAYEAETGEPYRPWIDAVRRLATAAVGGATGNELALLMPVFGEAAAAAGGSRERLFGAFVDLIAARAQAGTVLIVLDDIQWCDDASAALLHYVVRMNRYRPIVVALAARDGELPDNPSMEGVLRSLRRERLLDEIALPPLQSEHTVALVSRLMPGIDAAAVTADSRGNPLFAIELARASPHRSDGLPPTISGLVRDRVSRLPVSAALLLRWAAVLGPGFSVRRLERLPDIDAGELVATLEILERHALIRAGDAGRIADGTGDAYAFVHDLVRQAVYADLSGPRRRLMHRRVAEMLLDLADSDAGASAEIVEHAALAGEFATAARACIAAGRRYLRIFANTEAFAMARRGQHYAASVGEPDRLRLSLELTEIELGARRPEQPDAVARRLEGLCERAIDYDCPEHARLGFHLLGHLRWEGGAWSEARRDMLRAEMVSRTAEPGEHAVALAEAARCLALLERDLGHAESLLLEAGALSQRAGGVDAEAIAAASGMLRLHQGQLETAAALFEDARKLARNKGDRYSEFQALEHLVIIAMQRGAIAEAARLTGELTALGDRLRDGSEAPFARALAALLCGGAERDVSATGFDAALDALRAADNKHRLAFILTRAAFADLASGEADRALRRAAEALGYAHTLERPSEVALARAALLRAAIMLGDREAAQQQAGLLLQPAGRPLSAEARAAVDAVLAEHGFVETRRPGRMPRHGASDRRKTVRTADHLRALRPDPA